MQKEMFFYDRRKVISLGIPQGKKEKKKVTSVTCLHKIPKRSPSLERKTKTFLPINYLTQNEQRVPFKKTHFDK